MSSKVMLSPLFKFPIPWMEQFFDNWNTLGGEWRHIIFTDQPLESRGNITVVPMTVEQFVDLVEQKTGVRAPVTAPSPKFGDMRPAFGLIFNEWAWPYDFWGHMDFDIVCGDVDKYATEEVLAGCDIFSTEPNIVNGIFSLYRNTDRVNNLFKDYPDWEGIWRDPEYHAFDERDFSTMIRQKRDAGTIKFHGAFYQEHDNQQPHNDSPKLKMDGRRLINSVTNDEMMIFHFRRTKAWPL